MDSVLGDAIGSAFTALQPLAPFMTIAIILLIMGSIWGAVSGMFKKHPSLIILIILLFVLFGWNWVTWVWEWIQGLWGSAPQV